MTKFGDTQEIRTAPPPVPQRGHWYLLTGLVIGIIFGLLYAWLVDPVVYERNAPGTLNASGKDVYRSLIAQVYIATGDLDRATLRLALLNDPDPAAALAAQAQRAFAQGNVLEARALAALAEALPSTQLPSDPITQPPVPEPSPTPAPPGIPTHTLPVPTSTP